MSVDKMDVIKVDQNENEAVELAKEIQDTVNENRESANKSKPKGELSDEQLNENAYSYLKLDEYTSEKFKIEIHNLPKHTSHTDIKNLFKKKFNLIVKKVKIVSSSKNSTHAYVSFSNEQEREQAIKMTEGFILRNYKLRASKALPVPDPRWNEKNEKKQNKINYDELSEETLQEMLFKQICPLWREDYDCQLKEKQNSHRTILNRLIMEIKQQAKNQSNPSKSIESANYDRDRYLSRQPELNTVYKEIKYVPDNLHNNYRNKCELAIGKDANGKKVVGFRLGTFSNNKVKIVKPLNCPLLNEKMNKIIDLFEQFINSESCELEYFDVISHKGHLKNAIIRTTQQGTMLIVVMKQTGLDDEKLENELAKLTQFIEQNSMCTSAYAQIEEIQLNASKTDNQLKHIYGDQYLIETMQNNKLKLRLSPFAFVQVNPKACEILYETIVNLANLNENCIVLDICCGVGSIGIFLANRVKHVLGVELCEEAVQDAIYNAKLNEINNIDFFNGYAEENLQLMLRKARRFDSCEIVAILDPPRAGLKNSIIKAIRNCKEITKLVYVSCEPRLSRQNLIEPPTKNFPAMPFNIIRSISVDMFPHTAQCELVTLFTRDTCTSSNLKRGNDENCIEEDVEVENKKVKLDVKVDDKIDELHNDTNGVVCHSDCDNALAKEEPEAKSQEGKILDKVNSKIDTIEIKVESMEEKTQEEDNKSNEEEC